MRDRNLFIPADFDAIVDPEEKMRVGFLSKLWYTVNSTCLEFQKEHMKEVLEGAPLEAFFTSYVKILRAFKKSRKSGDKAVNFARSVRVSIYDGLFGLFKRFAGVYEARFEEEFDYYESLTQLSFECGCVVQMMNFAIEGRLNHAEYHIWHTEALQRGGAAKNAKSNKAKEFVIAEWARHREAYENNKSAFARHYVRRVKNEFHANVTDKTIREVWLVEAPFAGKQAG